MSSFQDGNTTIALLGEDWKAHIRDFAGTIDTPEARMLSDRLEAGQSGQVEDLLAVVVLTQAAEQLLNRVEALESRQH